MVTIKKINLDFILKNKIKDTDIVIIDKFNEINDYMRGSTNTNKYKSKKTTQNSDKKWFRKKFKTTIEKYNNKVNSYLNKFTDKNYKKISEDILKLKIDSEEKLIYLIDLFFQKSISESNYIFEWSYLLNKIITNNKKWIFNGKNFCFIICEKAQNHFEEIINSDYHNKLLELKNTNTQSFYIRKRKSNGFMILLSKIFKLKIINYYVISTCINLLTSDIESYYEMELGITLMSNLYKNLDKRYQEELLTKINDLMKHPTLNKKIKFQLMDFFDMININPKKIVKKTFIKKKTTEYNTDKEIEIKLKNLINEYLIHQNFNEALEYYKEFKIPHNSNKFIYYFIINLINLNEVKRIAVTNLFIHFVNKNKIRDNNIKYGLIDILNEYDELVLDYPNLEKVMTFLLTKLYNKNIINCNFFDDILLITNHELISNLSSSLF